MRFLIIFGYALLAGLPLGWLVLTSLKPVAATTSTSLLMWPGIDFIPTLAAYGDLFTGDFPRYLGSSVVIAVTSTIATVLLGTACAYGFSRFPLAGSKDWLFFILSTRFMPPLAVVAPVLVMYRMLDLPNTHLGLIILYTAFNLSLAVWLMKGFIDDIPRAFEEAALVDGYTRWQAFWRVIVPQARTGMAVTAVFCLISAWNEYGFAMTLNHVHAVTVPVWFAGLQGNVQGVPWPTIAGGVLVFVSPIIVFTVLVRKHLLRGVTFGTVKG